MDAARPWDVATLLARAAASEARAEKELERARRAEALAESGSARLRDVQMSAARAHRSSAQLHRASANMHRSLARQLTKLTDHSDADRIVAALAETCHARDVAMLLTSIDGVALGAFAQHGLAETAQQLEFVYGEGPLRTASATRRVVRAGGDEIEQRWPHLAPHLRAAGVSSVIAAPLKLATATVGALGVYDPPDKVDRRLVRLAADGFVQLMAASSGTGERRHVLDLLDVGGMRRVHEAAVMVADEAGCGVQAAVDLIRARAFAEGTTAEAVAEAVLVHGLRLTL